MFGAFSSWNSFMEAVIWQIVEERTTDVETVDGYVTRRCFRLLSAYCPAAVFYVSS